MMSVLGAVALLAFVLGCMALYTYGTPTATPTLSEPTVPAVVELCGMEHPKAQTVPTIYGGIHCTFPKGHGGACHHQRGLMSCYAWRNREDT